MSPAPTASSAAKPPLRQWDIVWVKILPDDRDHHPAVVFSCDEVACSNTRHINVLYGTTLRGNPRPTQLILDQADGLDHPTAFDCAIIHAVERAWIRQVCGRVTAARIDAVKRLIRSVHRLG